MSESEVDSSINQEDLMKILVASDIHLGYNEKDPVRGNDSFIAFEEILQNAVNNNVDFILLGGDLFHDAKPSPNTLQKCLRLLKTYTLGDKQIEIEFLSDQAVNFYDSLSKTVNYEDPNINIAYPVFSIHGNHDDPSGFGRLSSLDLLSTTGLVNYFGKWVDLTKVDITPLLIRKGKTQLALYGLSHIHDCRLARLFHDSKVLMEKPEPETGTWFNVLVLHQNRADRGPKNYLPEEILPEFLDLVIWGHEHDCRIWPEENSIRKFFVSQPGSSVATSLAEGEAIDKHVGLLMICGNKFKLEPLKLKSVRPFIFETVHLTDLVEELMLDEGDASGKVQNFATGKIQLMMEKAKEKYTDHPDQPKEPLIRLRLIYSDEDQMFNTIRFGQQYNTKVANPMDIVLFKRMLKRTKKEFKSLDEAALQNAFNKERAKEDSKVEDIVDRYFKEVETKQLEVLFSKSLSEFCRRLVESADDDAAENIIKWHKQKAFEFLNGSMPAEDQVDDELDQFRMKEDEIYLSTLKMLDERGSNILPSPRKTHDDSDTDLVFVPEQRNGTSSKSTKTARGRATASSATNKRGGRGGARAPRNPTRTEIKPPEKAKPQPAQPKIDSVFSQKAYSTRNRSSRVTQYISDSD